MTTGEAVSPAPARSTQQERSAAGSWLHPGCPADLTDCSTLLIRMLRLDAVGLVRLQQVGENVSLWAQPLGVVVRREIRARMTVGDRTVSAAELLTAVTADTAGAVALPAPRDEAWRVTLPPRSGWSVLDSVPVQVIRDLADSAGRVVRAATDPVGAGESLLDQETLRVSQGGDVVVVPLRVVAVLNRMGFVGAEGHSADVVRVACTPAWTRLAARHGTVYQRRGGLRLGPA